MATTITKDSKLRYLKAEFPEELQKLIMDAAKTVNLSLLSIGASRGLCYAWFIEEPILLGSTSGGSTSPSLGLGILNTDFGLDATVSEAPAMPKETANKNKRKSQ